jgi:hypothetical protein
LSGNTVPDHRARLNPADYRQRFALKPIIRL